MTQYTIQLVEDENGDTILPLPDDVVTQLGWKEGDSIAWSMADGAIAMTKVDPPKQLVMVESISTFRHRYLVEVPEGEKDWASDTVAMDEASEFSQTFLGETIVSERVVTKETALKLFREDNVYFNGWTDDKILSDIINQPGVSK